MRKNIMNVVNGSVIKMRSKAGAAMVGAGKKLQEKNGNFFEEALKYIIGFVLGALFLAILYVILKNTIGPALAKGAADLFNYSV